MEDIIITIVEKIVEYTVGPILHHAKYLCCFNNFAGNLPSAKEKLEVSQKSVKDRTQKAINKTEKIDPNVEKWLKDVEEVLKEVQLLEERIKKVKKSYFRRQCQYSLAKEIARTIDEMDQLNQNKEFDPFSHTTELPGMKYYSSKDFVLFKSTESAYNRILEALKDESVCMIGLVGIGGSGKTTLAKEMGKKAEELKLFEKVVMAVVSETPNIRSIQAQIADKLGVKLVEESNEGRAQRLSKRLSEGTTLLILDDVWEKLDLAAIGIPSNGNNKGCRVFLTTRKRDVCTSMQCQSIIELNLLTSEEAWTLFKLYANITNDNSSYALKDVATKIVDECKGLPIAIVTVGSTLKGKSFEVWTSALSRLQDSKPLVNTPKGLRSPHACLQLSYDNLTDELSKSLFLLCSLFPEDHEIDVEDLFRFGSGLGMIGTRETMEKARGEMHVAIDILMDSCLLLHVKNKKVKMHDMVRDVALLIACERGLAILGSTKMDPRMLLKDEAIKDMTAISLWDLENDQLLADNQMNCPTLQILLFHSRKVGFEVSNTCLQSLEMLKVLAFLTYDYTWIFSLLDPQFTLLLSQSIESLKNLHTLCLRGYNLGDISILENLEALEILDLRGSSFKELPNGIAILKKLKLLDLYGCWIKKNNAYKVIGRCLQLEELYLYLLQSKEDFPHDVSFSRLKRYVIIQHSLREFNYDYEYTSILEEHRPSRALSIEGFNVSVQSFVTSPIKDLFRRAEYLHLEDLQGGYKNVISLMDQQGMNQLIFLILERCPKIESLFDSTINVETEEALFSSLVQLRLISMDSLKEVFHDRCSLKNLEVLRIVKCPMLTSLFTPSIVQSLKLLKSLIIEECKELKHIIKEVEEGNNVDYDSNTQSHISFSTFTKLKVLEIKRCKRLEYIFPMCCAGRLVSLETLHIKYCCKLKYVFGTEKERSLSEYQHQSHDYETNLVNFHALWLDSLPELVNIWPEYYRPHLSNLRRLWCIRCPTLQRSFGHKVMIDSYLHQDSTAKDWEILSPVLATTFNQFCHQMLCPIPIRDLYLSDLGVRVVFQFQIREPETNRKQDSLNFDIRYVILRDLPKLEFIWKGPTNFLSLQFLREIYVNGCPELKTIFSPTVVRSLPMLTYFSISNCEKLDQIFDSGDAQDFKGLYTSFHQVCFPTLWWIEVKNCNKLKCLFNNFVAGHFPCLTGLEIEECSQLEKVFAFEPEVDGVDSQEWTDKDIGGEQVLLHILQDIRLTRLPNFKEIHHGFKLKEHVEHRINDCGKYSPSLYLDPGA